MDKKNQVYVYWPDDELGLIKRARAIARKYKLSFSSVLRACLAACIDTIEHELPRKRVFKLNGKDVTL